MTPTRRFAIPATLLAAALALSPAVAQPKAPETPKQPEKAPAQGTPTKAPADQPAGSKPAEAPAGEYKTGEELLDALETADLKIKTLIAELRYVAVASDVEGNDPQTRHGTLYFRNRPEPKSEGEPAQGRAAAAVQFHSLILASNKQQPERKTYVVSNGQMLERIQDEKLINRFKFKDPNQDPLKLGEGPFPLPFGQKKVDVLARFKADIVPSAESAPGSKDAVYLKVLAETYQIKLTPKANAGISSNVKEIRVWYRKKDLFPFIARIMRPGGAYDEFMLITPQINVTLPESVFDTAVPAGWKVEDKERP